MQPLNSTTANDGVWYASAVIPPPPTDYDEKRYTRVVIDSKDRDLTTYPSPTKYAIPLHDDIEDVVNAQLVSSDIPLSGYIVNAFHNTIPFKIGTTNYTAILDVGDYTASELAAEIQAKMNAAAGSSVFTVTHSTKTGKLIFTHSSTNFSLMFNTTNANSMSRILGFLPNKTYNSASNTITAPAKLNLNYFRYVVMSIDQFTNNHSVSSVLNKSFAIIFDSQSQINTNDPRNIIKTFTPPISRLSRLIVSFEDRDGNPYDFNGVDHTFEIVFTSYKQKRKYATGFSR